MTSTDKTREDQAAALAFQMATWLRGTGVGNDIYRLVVNGSAPTTEPADLYAADLIEWCRAARDMLAAFGSGSLIGTEVIDAHDDSGCPVSGSITDMTDDPEWVMVRWGIGSAAPIREPLDALSPVR